MRPELTPVRPVGGGNPQRQVGRVLRANFGVSYLTASPGPGSSKMETISGGYKCTLESPHQSSRTSRIRLHPYRVAELQRQPGQSQRGRRPPARAAYPQAPAEWPRRIEDHPLASGWCPRARPPPAASARGQVHAGGAAVVASICSLHSHRPAPRRAPGRWSFGGLSY